MAHVASIPKASELVQLSVSERLELMDEIWASLAAEQESVPLPEWHIAEVQRRLTALAADGNPGAQLKAKYPKLETIVIDKLNLDSATLK